MRLSAGRDGAAILAPVCLPPWQPAGQASKAAGGLIVTKPAILAVDDDPAVAAAITRDLRSRYAESYRVVRATSGREALEVLANLALRDQPVALIVADQRMPQMTGIEMLEQAR